MPSGRGERENAVGPALNGLFGRKAGTVDGYSYSPANKNSGLTWDEATFRDYIKDPKAKMPGTKMVYAGLKDEKRIDDLIAYLHGSRASLAARDPQLLPEQSFWLRRHIRARAIPPLAASRLASAQRRRRIRRRS
jgi:hypothetical protein